MSKHIDLKNTFQFFIIFLFGVYNTSLFLQNKLTFYIHPRYNWLSIAAAVIALIVGSIGIALNFKKRTLAGLDHQADSSSKPSGYADFILLGILLIGIFVPPAQLSSATALQRSTTLTTVTTSSTTQESIFFTTDYTKFTLGDWHTLFISNPGNSYIGKPLHVSGFVYHDPAYPSNYFFVSRFVLTCCAVDATPVSLLVKAELPDDIKDNDWIDLTGKFSDDTIKGQSITVVTPDNITKISQPDNPYIY